VEVKELLQVALVLQARQKRKVSRTPPLNRQTPPNPKDIIRETLALAEQSYDQLEGDWQQWLEVARRYEHKVPSQDRADIRHDIMLELHRARQRDNKPLPLLRAYRIASLMIALYWRDRVKREVKVCVYSGLPTEPHCASCKRHRGGSCPYLALRPVESLDQLPTDYLDTVADDKAIDLDLRIDASTWLLGCPMRLIEIASKRLDGKPLANRDRMYLSRYRKQTQKTLF